MAKRRTNLVRRRSSRRTGLISSLTSAIASTAKRPVGVLLLIVTIIFTINYNSDPTHVNNWITKWAAKLEENAVWKWLGTYLKDKSLQVVQSMWLVTVCFLSTNYTLATLSSVILTALNLSFPATTNWDTILQALFTFIVLAVRNPGFKLVAIFAFIIAFMSGHIFTKVNFQ